jgi:hypothetical protein
LGYYPNRYQVNFTKFAIDMRAPPVEDEVDAEVDNADIMLMTAGRRLAL